MGVASTFPELSEWTLKPKKLSEWILKPKKLNFIFPFFYCLLPQYNGVLDKKTKGAIFEI